MVRLPRAHTKKKECEATTKKMNSKLKRKIRLRETEKRRDEEEKEEEEEMKATMKRKKTKAGYIVCNLCFEFNICTLL